MVVIRATTNILTHQICLESFGIFYIRSTVVVAVCLLTESIRSGIRLQSCRYMSELPYHIIHPMPALSPTMETGTIASWYLKEGDAFHAGDAMAKIETDKASIDFEAQDDGFIAKILVKEGSEDVTVGSPIMVTVEDADAVAAFQDFVLPSTTATTTVAAAATAVVPEEPVKVAPAVSPPAVVATPPPPSVTPAAVVAAPPPVAAPPAPIAARPVTLGPAWGSSARVTSPIAQTLSKQQKAYVALYGSTGQLPL